MLTGAHRPPAALETALFRVAQEALHNVAKHGQATRATIRLVVRRPRLDLEIADDGVGFGEEPTVAATRGTGLAGLAERLLAWDGTLTATNNAGGGACVVASVPLSALDDARDATSLAGGWHHTVLATDEAIDFQIKNWNRWAVLPSYVANHIPDHYPKVYS